MVCMLVPSHWGLLVGEGGTAPLLTRRAIGDMPSRRVLTTTAEVGECGVGGWGSVDPPKSGGGGSLGWGLD